MSISNSVRSQEFSRRSFIKKLGASAATMSLIHLPKLHAGTQRPNILWILSEDICPDLSCYGTPAVKTPNLDKMAAEGIRFTNAFTTAPVCSASRSAMITGMYQTTIGAHQHRSQRDDHKLGGSEDYFPSYYLPEPIKPITEYLRQAGYYCVNQKAIAPGVSGTGKTDFNFLLHQDAFDGDDWANRQPGQPFFAQLSIKLTHRGPQWKELAEHVPNRVNPQELALPSYIPDHPVARRDWANYLDSIQWMDQWIGVIMKKLEDEGIADNTVVIFIGDHGRCQVRGKQWVYDAGISIPLLVRWPAKIKPGVCDDLVSGIDISYTVLKLAGIDPPEHLQGQDFLDEHAPKRQYIYAARDRCDETIETIRCVRTKKYKYIRNYMYFRPYMAANHYKDTEYPIRNLFRELHAKGELTPIQERWMAPVKPFEELYDVENDPDEVVNLASRPEYANILSKLRTEHFKWMYNTRDLGLIPEPILEDLGKQYGSKMAVLQDKKNRKMIPRIVKVIEEGLQGVASLDKLVKSLEDKSDSVRFWAAISIGNLGQKAKVAAPVLQKALKDPSASVRIAAARALAEMNHAEEATAVLLTEMQNHNHEVRHYSALFLEDIANRAKEKYQHEPYLIVHRVVDRIFESF